MWVPVGPSSARQYDVVSGTVFAQAGDQDDIGVTASPLGGMAILQNSGISPFGYYECSSVFGFGTASQTIAVWVPAHTAPVEVGGALLKVGNESSGVALGLGTGTFSNGSEVVALFEALRWINPGVAIDRTKHNLIALSLPVAGNGVAIYLNGVPIYSDTSGGPVAASGTTGLMGYTLTGGGRLVWAAASDFKLWNREFSANEHWALYDPATRWDLYWVPGRRVFFDVAAAPSTPEGAKIIFRNVNYV